jgi:hypothetical protein
MQFLQYNCRALYPRVPSLYETDLWCPDSPYHFEDDKEKGETFSLKDVNLGTQEVDEEHFLVKKVSKENHKNEL